MNRNEIIALLKSWGVTVANDATDEWLKAKLAEGKPATKTEDSNVVDLKKEVEEMKADRAAERKGRIEAALQTLVAEEKMSKEQVAAWLDQFAAGSTDLLRYVGLLPI